MMPTAEELQLQIQARLVEQLSARDREFGTLVDLLGEIVLRCDAEARLNFLNSAWTRLLGIPVAESLGGCLLDHVVDEDVSTELASAFAQDLSISREVRIRSRFGGLRILALRATRDGRQWYASMVDVTEHRLAQQALEENENWTRKLSLVARKTDNMVVITDARGRTEWVNAAFEEATGYRLGELRGRSPGGCLQGPQTDVETIRQMHEAVACEQGFSCELVNYTKAGAPYWVRIECSPVFDDAGVLQNFIAIERDVSATRAAEAALRRSEERHRQVLNAVSEVIFRCDAAARLDYLNPAWVVSTGQSLEASVGQSLLRFIHPDDQAELRQALKMLVGGEPAIRREVRLCHQAQGWRRFELLVAPAGAAWEQAGYIGTLVDIEERWQAAQALALAKEQAESLSRARTRFVANMSHEIRTPLNAILGMASVLQDSALDAEQQACLDTIQNSGQALLAVVNDVLDFAKLESGQLPFEDVAFATIEPFEDAIEMILPQLREKGLSLRLLADQALPQRLIGDPHRLRQVILNLLSNAAKFTAQGGITLRLQWQCDAGDAGALRVDVEDTGLGIETDRVAVLFDEFIQADPSTTRQYGGTGLGLAICRQICEQSGGRIWAESEPASGSRFHFIMRMRRAEEVSARQPESVLVHGGLAPDILPVLALTARWQRCGLESAAEFRPGAWIELRGPRGAEAVLDPAALEAVISPRRIWRCLSKPRPGAALLPPRPALGKGLKILVAEDVPVNQLVLRTMLSRAGCEDVTVVDDGEAAVAAAGRQDFDLILTDLHMPVLDGLGASTQIRALPLGRQPLIFAVSADATPEAQAAAVRAGIDHWLSKPMARAELEQVLRLVQRAMHLDQELAQRADASQDLRSSWRKVLAVGEEADSPRASDVSERRRADMDDNPVASARPLKQPVTAGAYGFLGGDRRSGLDRRCKSGASHFGLLGAGAAGAITR